MTFLINPIWWCEIIIAPRSHINHMALFNYVNTIPCVMSQLSAYIPGDIVLQLGIPQKSLWSGGGGLSIQMGN